MASVYRTWADGDAFTASDAGTYFMRQVTIACNNSTDRDAILTPQEGMNVYRKDINAYEVYTGSSWLTFDTEWQTYTPDVYTNGTLWFKGNGVAVGRYFRTGKKLDIEFSIQLGTTTTWGGGSGVQEITLPAGITLAALLAVNPIPMGVARIINSATGEAPGMILQSSTLTRIKVTYSQYMTTPNNPTYITHTAPFTTGADDVICGTARLPIA